MKYKHQLKKRVFQNGMYREVVIHTNDEYGSGRLDKNGKEIFENDLVKDRGDNELLITFKGTRFYADDIPLDTYADGELEIVGHKWG